MADGQLKWVLPVLKEWYDLSAEERDKYVEANIRKAQEMGGCGPDDGLPGNWD